MVQTLARRALPDEARKAFRTMIVDDHALFRRGLEMVLEDEPDIELVGQAGGLPQAIAASGSRVYLALGPRVVDLDATAKENVTALARRFTISPPSSSRMCTETF